MSQQPEGDAKHNWVWWTICIAALFLFVAFVLAAYAQNWVWSGFTAQPPQSATDSPEPAKNVWDWLGLLIIPIVLAVGGFIFTKAERENDRKIEQRRADLARQQEDNRRTEQEKRDSERYENERKLARDQANEAALHEYYDRMSDLLISHKLAGPEALPATKTVARARTLSPFIAAKTPCFSCGDTAACT